MKYIKPKLESDIRLNGITIELEQMDGKVHAVILTDINGKLVKIEKDGTYSDHLRLMIPEPIEYKIVYQVSIKMHDGGVLKYTLTKPEDVQYKIAEHGEDNVTYYEDSVEVKKNLEGKII
jgi:hypothetical protein